MAIAAVQGQGQVPAPQPTVEPSRVQPQSFIPRLKENAVWAWNATLEKLETVGSNLKRILLKVIEAIREFFAPKFESMKQAAVDLYERFTKKPVVTSPAATPPAIAPVVVRPPAPKPPEQQAPVLPHNFEFVPQPQIVEQPALAEEPVVIQAPEGAPPIAAAVPVQVEQPVVQQQQPPVVVPEPQPQQPPVIAPVVQQPPPVVQQQQPPVAAPVVAAVAQPQQVAEPYGIFSRIWNYFAS